MQNVTRLAFKAYLSQIAQLNGVPSAIEQFTVEPSVQQKLEKKIQQSSDFLTKINVIGVSNQEGEKIGIGVRGTSASTTDTKTKSRVTTDISSMDSNKYRCEQINFDTHINYGTLDAWSDDPNFQVLLRNVITQQQALDRMMIGFNGTHRAPTSDRNANPMLQDVAVGWLQSMRNNAPQRVMDHGTLPGKVRVGQGGDYLTIDALVYDARKSLLDPWFRQDNRFVAICGDDLLHDKYFPLVNKIQPNTENLAADLIISQSRLGGLQAAGVPYFPSNSVLITTFNNLSMYYLKTARRRHVKDNPERDRIENYDSSKDAFVIEDFGAACLVENIEIM